MMTQSETTLRRIVGTLSGFTPAPDYLIKNYGYVTALVWGRIWRYCQGPKGVCTAKLELIADELNMSVRTIIRHAETLCNDGYLFDTTPKLRNRPHVYADTGKIRIRISVEAAMTESHSAVTLSHSHSDSESLEESNKKQVKKLKPIGAKAPKANTFPELVLIKELTGYFPARGSFESVIASVRKMQNRLGRPVSLNDLQPYFTAWCNAGAKPTNLAWLLEHAVPGIPIARNKTRYGKQSTPSQQAPASSLSEAELAEARRVASESFQKEPA